VAKPSKLSTAAVVTVRTRRAYFDCQFGQLHVRTAFPTTGGFDEQVTLFCLHPRESSSRSFAQFLPAVADVRSVYAPDLPGCGESDPTPHATVAEAALAVCDLARDLRLRQIDLLGAFSGAAVAAELAAAQPELVRRVVLVGLPPAERMATVRQPALVLRTRSDGPDAASRARTSLIGAKFVELPDLGQDLFDVAAADLAGQVDGFLSGRS
jgi:pimeloyl-ACP methyl ester carboxylesterase